MPGEEFARKQAAAREEREQRRKEAEEKAASQPKSQTTAVPKREPVKAGFKRASPPATGDLPALGTLPKRRVSASRLTENTPDAQLAKENASAGTRKPSGSGSSIPPVVRHRAVPPPAAPKPQPRTLTGVKTAREQAAQKEKGIESKKPTVPVLATKAKSSDNLPEAEKARLIARKRTMETIKAWETQKKGQLPNQKQPIGNQNIKPAQVPVAATVVEAAAAALSVDAATPAETS